LEEKRGGKDKERRTGRKMRMIEEDMQRGEGK
jgi:hypothetical protein